MRNPRRHDRELTHGLDVVKPLGVFQTEMQKGFSSDSRSSLIPLVLERHTSHYREWDSPGRRVRWRGSQLSAGNFTDQRTKLRLLLILTARVRGWGGRLSAARAPEAPSLSTLPLRPGRWGVAYHGRAQKVHPDAAPVTSTRVSVAGASVLYLPDLSGAGEGRPTGVSKENSPVLQEPPNHMAQ